MISKAKKAYLHNIEPSIRWISCWQNDKKVDYFHFAMSMVAYDAKTRQGEYLWCLMFKLIFQIC